MYSLGIEMGGRTEAFLVENTKIHRCAIIIAEDQFSRDDDVLATYTTAITLASYEDAEERFGSCTIVRPVILALIYLSITRAEGDTRIAETDRHSNYPAEHIRRGDDRLRLVLGYGKHMSSVYNLYTS